MSYSNKNSITHLTSDVINNGRKGEPRPGCDCMQCFGYCMVDKERAVRERPLMGDARYGVRRIELDFQTEE